MSETLEQAEAAVRAGDMAKAADLYRAIEARDGESAPVHYGLGFIALHGGDAAEAHRRLSACLALDAAHHKARAALGSAALALGRPTEALEAFERTQSESPTPAGAINIAVAALQAGRFDRALAALDKSLGRIASGGAGTDPRERAECLRLKAEALAGLARLEEGLAAAAEAQRLDPRSPVIGQTLGILLRRARRPDESLRHLLAAWEGGLRLRALALEIAETQQARRDGSGCLEWLDRALVEGGSIRGARDRAALWSRAAGLYERENALERARDAVDRALALDPRDGQGRLVAAILDRRAGALEDAQARLHELLAEPGAAGSRTLQFEAARLADRRGAQPRTAGYGCRRSSRRSTSSGTAAGRWRPPAPPRTPATGRCRLS